MRTGFRTIGSWLDEVDYDKLEPINDMALQCLQSGAAMDQVSQPGLRELLAIDFDKAQEWAQEMFTDFPAVFKAVDIFEDNTMVCEFSLKKESKNVCLMARGYPMGEQDTATITNQLQDLVKKGFVEELEPGQYPQVL